MFCNITQLVSSLAYNQSQLHLYIEAKKGQHKIEMQVSGVDGALSDETEPGCVRSSASNFFFRTNE